MSAAATREAGAPVVARVPYDACPLCGHEDATELGHASCARHPLYRPELPPTMRWLACDRCAHVFVDGYFDARGLDVLLAKAHASQTPGNEAAHARGVSAAIVERVTAARGGAMEGRWLDVGFGNGALLTTAEEHGYDVVGLDLRRASVARMRAFGYEAHAIDLVDYESGRPFDVISMADVLEHMPFPVPALAKARALLAPDGVLFVSAPNMDAFVWKELDARRANPYWGDVEHLHNFGRRRLYALLRETGFEPRGYAISRRYVAGMEVIARARR